MARFSSPRWTKRRTSTVTSSLVSSSPMNNRIGRMPTTSWKLSQRSPSATFRLSRRCWWLTTSVPWMVLDEQVPETPSPQAVATRGCYLHHPGGLHRQNVRVWAVHLPRRETSPAQKDVRTGNRQRLQPAHREG